MNPKERAIHALGCQRGDNLYRARAAFNRMTPEEMQKQHGQSGKTRAQILAEYEQFDAEIDAAIAWIRSKPL